MLKIQHKNIDTILLHRVTRRKAFYHGYINLKFENHHLTPLFNPIAVIIIIYSVFAINFTLGISCGYGFDGSLGGSLGGLSPRRAAVCIISCSRVAATMFAPAML